MPEIAGYADTLYIKGQYYKVAASPMPTAFVGDIDNISGDTLLTRAMYVTRSQSQGTLPNDTSNEFLITTVKYGDGLYLQTAYTYNDGNVCYEYRRIYNGEWSQWVSSDVNIENMSKSVQDATDAANNCNTAITAKGGINEQLNNIGTDITGLKNTDTRLSNSISSANGKIDNVSKKVTLEDASSKYSVAKTSGAWNCHAVLARKFGNVVNMRIEFDIKKNVNVNAGSNAFVGKINAPAEYIPFFTSFLVSCFTTSNILAWIDENGNLTVRVLNSAIKPGSDTIVGIGGTFIVGG